MSVRFGYMEDHSHGPGDEALRRIWLLVPSPLLGPASWAGVAQVLEDLRQRPVVPAPRATTTSHEDHIAPWVQDVISSLPPLTEVRDTPVVVVGHSATCPRLPYLADRLLDKGYNVESVVLVNGRFPADGKSATDVDSPMVNLLDGLTRPDGYLPPWPRWWGSMVEDMLPDPELREKVLGEARPTPRAMFDQPIPAPDLPRRVGLAFLATGDMYSPSHDQARAEGWTVARLDGEHLHQVVDPVTVACSLMSLSARSRRSETEES